MKEQLVKDFANVDCLRVYPHAPDDISDRMLAGVGSVEAVNYWPDPEKPKHKIWGVRINITYGMGRPLLMKQTEELKSAIDRCWQWIAEQEKSNGK